MAGILFVLCAALCGLTVGAVEFTASGEPCLFPFEFQGAEFRECVEGGSGQRFCKNYEDGWAPCAQLSFSTTSSQRKVVPQLLPFAELATESSNFTEVETVDLTALYYGVTPSEAVLNEGVLLGECCSVLAELGFQSSLPIVIIETGGQEIPDEPKTEATLCTCGSPGDEYDGAVGIEIRGSTSARDFAKKSFAFETRSADGTSQDVSLLGLPVENDWILYGPETDKTMGMRNVMSYTLARASGRYASRLKYCEVFITKNRRQLKVGDYNGIYLLAENVKRGINRVNIQRQTQDTIEGGYIVKHDNDNNDPGDTVFAAQVSTLPMILVYPKDPTQQQISFIKEAVDEFEGVLASNNFKDQEEGYHSYIDVDSFVDYFLLSEVTKNPDSYRGSAFFYKDAGMPIVMGPVWDYNEAFGICCGFPIEGFRNNGFSTGRSGGSAISPEGWRFNICIDPERCRVDRLDGVSLWYRRLWQDMKFRKRVQTRWTMLRAGAWNDLNIQSIFDDIRSNVETPVMRNYAIWGNAVKGRSSLSNLDFWLNEVEVLHQWLFERLAWLDEQLIKDKKLYSQLTSAPVKGAAVEAGR